MAGSSKQRREQYLQKTYDITEAEYQAILAWQGGVCAICGRPPAKRQLSVDHSHRMAKLEGVRASVRGLLHYRCNAGIEVFHDDPALFRRVAEYLEHPPAQDILMNS